MKIAVLSNINVFKLIHKMKKWAEVSEADGYGSWIQPLLSGEQPGDYMLCLLDGRQFFSGLERPEAKLQAEERVREYSSYIETAAKQHPEKKYFISNMDILAEGLFTLQDKPYLRLLECTWESEVYRLSREYPNIYVFPLKDIITDIGREEAYSNKMWYLASSRFSKKIEEKIEYTIFKMIAAVEGKRKKCLLLDLDHTLWGGVLGEEGIEGIQLSENKEGARYKDFQKKIKALKEMGVLLGIVSKNNEADAKEMFESHPDMILKWDDFVARKIGWQPKSISIREIQEELNIGFDSMVFLDDNPVEREEIKHELPEVIVPGFPADSAGLADFMEGIYQEYFLTAGVTQEDKNKTRLYQQRKQRERERKNHSSLDDYLKSLKTKITIEKLKEADVGRAVQLVQKTNQFNLTTRRYTETEIRNLQNKDTFDIWIAGVEDQFGNNGKTALVMIEKGPKTVKIDSFIMSCRIMGRYIEDSILHEMEKHYFKQGYEKLLARYVATQKNKPVENLYERIGYTLLSSSEDEKKYEFSLVEREDTGFSEVQWKER